jgi:carbon monoxide dehydrogenase subunit G
MRPLRMEHTVRIDRSPADVFGYLTAVERLPEWQSSAVEVSAEGELGVGTRIREIRNFLGRRAESTLEVTEYEPARKFSLRVLSGPLPFEVRHTLTPEGEGTRLDWVAEADTSRFPKLAVRMMAGTAERQFKSDLERLKRVLEGRAHAG